VNKLTEQAPQNPLRLYFGIAMVIIGLLALYSGISSLLDNRQRLFAPKGTIVVELAETPAQRTLGLSGRDSLPKDEGLLFIFDQESESNCFWMKDMNFAIDMVWLDSDKNVVTIKENATPESYETRETFCPDQPAKYGLEINTGKAAELGIEPTEKLRF
jgi:uncharacterized membrane protein (UPF0127 family)